MKIKVFWENIKRSWRLSNLWDESKKFISQDLDMGNPIDIVDRKETSRTYCPSYMPSDYYSQTDYKTNLVVKTDKENILHVEQFTYGVVWDNYKDKIVTIKNDKGEELLKTSLCKKQQSK